MRLTILEHNVCDGGLTMTHAQSSGAPAQERAEHERLEKWMSAAAALAVGGAFFALWFWLLPGWLGFRVETVGTARWRWLAAIPSVLGFAVALRCIWDFGWTGRGTPAPFAPPQRSSGGLLPLRAQPDVRRLRSWLDRAVGRFRTCQP